MKSIVVAYDQNHAIGIGGELPWGHSLPTDFKHVKDLTTGKSIIMGRATFESMGKPLPNRQNIIVSHRPVGVAKTLTAGSLAAAYALAQYDIVLFGGGSIYEQALPHVDRIYATEVQHTFEGATAFFPKIDMKQWSETAREHHMSNDSDAYDFDFVTYDRV